MGFVTGSPRRSAIFRAELKDELSRVLTSTTVAGIRLPVVPFPSNPVVDTKPWEANVAVVVSAAVNMIIIGIFAVALIVLAITFLVRLAVLFMLLTLAAAPYALNLVPAASAFAKQWWGSFLKYVMYLPLVVVFLVMASKLLEQTGPNTGLVHELLLDVTLLTQAGTGTAEFAASTMHAFLAATFIVVAIVMGRAMSVAGSGAALAFGRGLMTRTAYYAGGVPAKYAGIAARKVGLAAAAGTARATGIAGLYEGIRGGLVARRQVREERLRQDRGARVGAWIATLGGGQRAYERVQNQRATELSKSYEEQNVGEDQTRGLLKSSNPIERRAAAMYGLKKEYLKDAEDFRAAIANVPSNSSTAKDIQKAFDKYNPALAVAPEITEADIENYKTSPAAERKVQAAIAKSHLEVQKALNRATAEDVAKWSGDLVHAILQGGGPVGPSLSFGSSRVRAILTGGQKEAQQVILDAYTKQTGKARKPSTPGPGGLTGAEEKAVERSTT